MEAIEEYSVTPHHRDHHSLVVKGKRTKRARPPSPPQGFAAAVTSSSSTACEYNSVVSPSSSSGNNQMCESTEEEEDMANCLILLAQGDAPRRIEEEEESDFHAKKSSEVPAVAVSPAVSVSAAARSGFDAYECKTCNRVFPSFQALGGHRASHKKPKTSGDDQKKPPIMADSAADGCEEERFVKRGVSPPLSLSLANNNKSLAASSSSVSPFHIQINNRPKIHGCSICGSEFTSGQALGGHMRRHRAPPPVTATRDSIISDDSSPIDEKPRSNILALDLNLPAPEEEKFQFTAAQSPIVVFSAPALVDCHY